MADRSHRHIHVCSYKCEGSSLIPWITTETRQAGSRRRLLSTISLYLQTVLRVFYTVLEASGQRIHLLRTTSVILRYGETGRLIEPNTIVALFGLRFLYSFMHLDR